MRYFRYNGPTQENNLLKSRMKNLTIAEQKAQRKAKWLHRLGTVVFWTVFFAVTVCLICLFRLLKPTDADILLTVLFWIGGLLWSLVSVCIGGVLGAIAAAPLWARHEQSQNQFRKGLLQEACAYLREFYGFREPFVVTKCFESTDRKFSRHDVCLFVVDGELRLTANLHYGFFHPEKDLGCYIIHPQEITLQDTLHKDRPAVNLTVGEVTFCLSRKAKPFLEQMI